MTSNARYGNNFLITMHKFLHIMLLFFILSCSPEKPADVPGQKPSENEKTVTPSTPQQQVAVSGSTLLLEITPVDVTRNSTINVMPKGVNLQDAKIVWLVNGNSVSVVMPNQFKAADAKKGDRVQAKAIIKDREVFSNMVTIKNALPELTKVKLMPEVFKLGDNLYIEASGTDIDGDEVTILYEWTKNNEPAGKGRQLTVPIKRGDNISVKVTPFDGEAYGRPVVLQRDIRNMPPIIIEDKKHDFDGKVFTYQVKATDPDGDPLTFFLKSGPSGMTIDSNTGLIQWNVPQDFHGKAPFTVSVNDGHGGEVSYSLDVTIMSEGR